MTQPALEATNRLLFASADLTAIVGNQIHEDYAPTSTTWPLINYFPVTGQSSYRINFDKTTIQISMWGRTRSELANIKRIVYSIFNEYSGKVTTYLGDVEVTWIDLADQGQLNPDDYPIYGYYYRFRLRVRGKNIGGI